MKRHREETAVYRPQKMTWSRPPYSHQEERSLLVPRSWTCGLQNCKTVFLLFKLCNLRYLIMDCCLVAQSCLTLRPHGLQHARFPVHHHFLELTQTHVHRVSDAIQPSHPLSSHSLLPSIFPSIRVFSMRQFFPSGGQSIGVSASASVLPMIIQD